MNVATTDAFRSINVMPDDITINAEIVGDTLTLIAGAGISLTADENLDKITITGTSASVPTSKVVSSVTMGSGYTLTSTSSATALTITVTPATATSLINVAFQFSWHPSEPESSGSTGIELYIYKNGVQQADSRYQMFTSGNGDVYNGYAIHYAWPDISGTTSSITYTVYAKRTGGNGGSIGTALGEVFPCWATIVG